MHPFSNKLCIISERTHIYRIFANYYGRPAQQMRTLYFCSVVSFFYLFFFPRLISAATDWMSTILRHMV